MSKFIFNPSTGTMEPNIPGQRIAEEHNVSEVAQKAASDAMQSVDLSSQKPNVAIEENIVQFRERSDYTLFQFIEPKTHNVVGYIGGYALDFSFNLEQIRSTERLEQLLDGIQSVFRKMISEQILAQVKKK